MLYSGSISLNLVITLEPAMTKTTPVTAIGEDQHMYQYIFENAVVGMFRTTPEGKLITVNPGSRRRKR